MQGRINWNLIFVAVILSAGAFLGHRYWFLKDKLIFPITERQSPVAGSYVKVISPNGGEFWKKTKEYLIQWDQKKLEVWGNKIVICVVASDVKGIVIEPKDKESDCYLYAKGSSVVKIALTDKQYWWKIPADIYSLFDSQPALYKIVLLVFDDRPQELRSAWAGLLAKDESDEDFIIAAD